MSGSNIEGLTQCTACHMYAVVEQQFQSAYLCCGCERIATLEARVRALEEHVATLRSINNLERGLLLTEQELVGSDSMGGGEQGKDDRAVSWVTVRKSSVGKRKREAAPGFAHPNRFARLCEEDGSVNSGLAVLGEADLSNSRETSFTSSGGEESRARPKQMVVIGDSIIRKVDRVICQADRFNRTFCCLPGARVRHVVDRVDTLLGGAGHDPAVLVHIGTNDKMNGRWGTLKSEFRDLGSKIRQRSSNVIFSEILPVPRASLGRQRELRELNAWLKSWCRKEGFGFLEHWADFSLGYNLYSLDGLHLNGRGSTVLGERMVKRLEECLN
uniref:SGNH hydrolase-type esterase domain-containing protein n=1 Tax=Xenopus tropicalis TaxID=8364 RepID=A0A6I8SSN1_XENTR